jgi:hypothetical protein
VSTSVRLWVLGYWELPFSARSGTFNKEFIFNSLPGILSTQVALITRSTVIGEYRRRPLKCCVHNARCEDNFAIRNRKRRAEFNCLVEGADERLQTSLIGEMKLTLCEPLQVMRQVPKVLSSQSQRRDEIPQIALVVLVAQLEDHLVVVVNDQGTFLTV